MCGSVSRLALLLVLWGLFTAVDVTQEKTLETGGADATLLCPNQTLTDIITVVCHKIRGTQVQQATDNSLFYWGMITGVAACVAVLVFGGVIMRKIHLRRTQLQVSGTVNEVPQHCLLLPVSQMKASGSSFITVACNGCVQCVRHF
ncbi:uncharacterized protein isoform X2 [Salmo salar]|uniref:Uncharacterized protein isoform X2 n=1 Tax=Salmo salar TaxID=8030 RepID=A0ABM3E9E4_SALSA|nr:uncharacterized protein LOC106575943 isoform X2 [Salmo salar]|eukprot:XP_014008174.1 PREDICTED: uncharacterized protein LOC106575943 isoform X2 [Salmo salar]